MTARLYNPVDGSSPALGLGADPSRVGPRGDFDPAQPTYSGSLAGGPPGAPSLTGVDYREPPPAATPTYSGSLVGGPARFVRGQAAVGRAMTPSGVQPSYQPPPPRSTAQGQYANPLFQQQQQTRDRQNDFLTRLEGDMAGRAPSLAQIQMQEGIDQSIAAQNAMAASAGPGNYAAASRLAANNTASMSLAATRESARLRAEEYARARGEYGAGVNTLRGQDFQSTEGSYARALQEAQFRQQQAQQQATLEMQQRGINQDALMGYHKMGTGVLSEDLASRMHYMDLMGQRYGADRGLAQNAAQFDANRSDRWLGAGIGAAGLALTMLSDETQKTDIAPAKQDDISDFWAKLGDPNRKRSRDGRFASEPVGNAKPSKKRSEPDDLGAFLATLNESTFKYKDQKHGKGEHFGIMAQDLEKSRIGKTMVVDTPDGKQVDMKKALGALLASGASHEKRIKKLEAQV